MRVSDEERSVGDGVYSRCPKGNYDVVGAYPRQPPRGLGVCLGGARVGPSVAESVGVAVFDPVPSWRPINICGVFLFQRRVPD